MKKHLSNLSAGVSVVLLLALSACGSAAAGTVGSSSSGQQVTHIVASVEVDSKPLSYTDNNGKLTGYEVELFKAIDAQLPNYTIDVTSSTPDGNSIGLDTGKYQVIGGGQYKTAERVSKYLLPGPTGASAIQLYEKQGSSYSSLADLVGKSIAPVSPNGGIYNLLTTYNAAHPNAKVTIATSSNLTLAEALQGVDSGKYDALVEPSNLGETGIIKSLGLKVTTAPKPVQVNDTYFEVKKSDTALYQAINQALQKLRSNGTLSKLSTQFFGEDVTKYLQ